MRLPDFITSNLEPILEEWEAFARSIDAGQGLDWIALRDHAALILQATATDMKSPQTPDEQARKSKGGEGPTDALDGASDAHAFDRLRNGFDMIEMMSEYRALRASVIKLWRDSEPDDNERDIDDVIRFNESIDQSLSTAIESYTKRVNQARVTFLAILGHDLRNPLNAIAMTGTLIPLVSQDEAETRECSEIIARSVASMNHMISDLLDFTRSQLGSSMPLTRAPMDLEELGVELVVECRAAHPSHDIRLKVAGDLQGNCDRNRIRQAISNLLGNAIQHGEPSSPVVLSLSGNHSNLIINVHNRGVPIPTSELQSIFEPLVRGAATAGYTGGPSGSIGLGLNIARQVSESHGGRIEVKSTAEDGTTFTIYLPRQLQ